MSKHRRELRVFGWEFTLEEVSVGALMISIIIAGVVGLLSSHTTILSASFLALMSTFAMYFLLAHTQAKAQAQKNHETLTHAYVKTELIKDSDDVFNHCSLKLEEGLWERVRIYAPIGLWYESKTKDQWLLDLKRALNTRNVHSLFTVYGLPPDSKSFFSHAKRRLELFKETPGTEIHYLPPENSAHPTAAPNVGFAIFTNHAEERYEAVFMYVDQIMEDDYTRIGLVIRDKPIVLLIADWFDRQVFAGKSRDLIIRGSSPNNLGCVRFDDAMIAIEQQYYKWPKAS